MLTERGRGEIKTERKREAEAGTDLARKTGTGTRR